MNAAGEESGNATFTDGRSLPWLQDTVDEDAWGLWGVDWRDVIVLDADNVYVGKMNLTFEDLADEANRDKLRDLLEDAGG